MEEPRSPHNSDAEKSRSFYDPACESGIEATLKKGADTGRSRATSHFPHAVIEDAWCLREFASKEYDRWYGHLIGNTWDEYAYAEMRRLYREAFSSAYKEQVERLRSLALEEREREEAATQEQAARDLAQKGVYSSVVSKRDVEGAVLYEVEFVDPARMRRPVSFGIQVGEDGVVEVQEL